MSIIWSAPAERRVDGAFMSDKLQFVAPCGTGFYRSIDKLKLSDKESKAVSRFACHRTP